MSVRTPQHRDIIGTTIVGILTILPLHPGPAVGLKFTAGERGVDGSFSLFLLISESLINICDLGASLVAWWLGVCLPVQGMRVRALVREDPACRGAAEPVSHNC